MNETPLNLAFGIKAMILVEVELAIVWTWNFYKTTNLNRLRAKFDYLEKIQDQAHLKIATYWQRVAQYYDLNMRSKAFHMGDFVLRRVEVLRPAEHDKLAPN